MENNGSYLDLMIDSLNKKIHLLEKIQEVNVHQKQIVSDARFEMEELDDTVEEKGRYIDEINKLDDGFETLYERVREALQENKSQYSQQISVMQQLIQRVVELSASIEAEEKRIKAGVENQFSKVKQAVKETRKNSRAVSNYYKNMTKLDSEPQFMDKKK